MEYRLASSMPVVPCPGFNGQSCPAQINETVRNEENRRKWRCFRSEAYDMAIQSQVFSTTSQLYILLTSTTYSSTTYKQKAPISMLRHSKAPKHNQLRVTNIREKPEDFFMAILLFRFLWQRFPFRKVYNSLLQHKN